MSWRGHYWTLRGFLERRRWRGIASPGEPWETEIDDPAVGPILLTGRWRPVAGVGAEGAAVVILHGMGGSADSEYVLAAAAAAERAGFSSLSLNVRGADRRGEDFFHAALTADLAAALASPELADARRVALVGYSLGGHMALTYAVESPPERLAAVAAISPPLDLAACCTTIDRPRALLYRRYLLAQLNEIYAAVAARRPVPVPPAEARRIRSQREFDHRIVAPRHGFDGVDDYYERSSVGPRLERLRVPTLLVVGRQDPLVPVESLEPFLSRAPDCVKVRRVDGGHVGFPRDLDLDLALHGSAAPGLESQVVGWLARILTLSRPSPRPPSPPSGTASGTPSCGGRLRGSPW